MAYVEGAELVPRVRVERLALRREHVQPLGLSELTRLVDGGEELDRLDCERVERMGVVEGGLRRRDVLRARRVETVVETAVRVPRREQRVERREDCDSCHRDGEWTPLCDRRRPRD